MSRPFPCNGSRAHDPFIVLREIDGSDHPEDAPDEQPAASRQRMSARSPAQEKQRMGVCLNGGVFDRAEGCPAGAGGVASGFSQGGRGRGGAERWR
jgi:hypothetical protein